MQHTLKLILHVSIPNGPHKPFQRLYIVWEQTIRILFQSLTGPTSHSNLRMLEYYLSIFEFQSLTGPTSHSNKQSFWELVEAACVSIPNGPHKPFQQCLKKAKAEAPALQWHF